jgi:hypothetical protein
MKMNKKSYWKHQLKHKGFWYSIGKGVLSLLFDPMVRYSCQSLIHECLWSEMCSFCNFFSRKETIFPWMWESVDVLFVFFCTLLLFHALHHIWCHGVGWRKLEMLAVFIHVICWFVFCLLFSNICKWIILIIRFRHTHCHSSWIEAFRDWCNIVFCLIVWFFF